MAGKRKPTVRDIAARAGVSPATVSAALRPDGDGSSVGTETRERIMEVADELGYDYSRLRSHNRRTRTVVVLIPSSVPINVSMRYRTLLGLSGRLSQHGFRMMVERGFEDPEDLDAIAEMFRCKEAEAAIALGFGESWAAYMADWGAPCVYIGPTTAGMPVCTVNVDDRLGGRVVGEHLWSLGHRDIAILHIFRSEWGDARREGIRSVWQRWGREIPEHRVGQLSDMSDGMVDAAIANLLADHGDGRPTALFCDADWVASRALRSIRLMGLRVPEDVSVVGFDDADFAAVLDPPLTTVRQPVREQCALAIELLLEQLNARQPSVRSYSLPCELIVRHTTAPIRG